MSERTYTTQDKTVWGPGPWQDEPDKVQWTDEETGMPCLAVRNRMGAWCGYAGVESDHPLYGKEYEAVEDKLEVHGGITFAAPCSKDEDEAESICHVPEPGKTDDVWWFGFDCLHLFDLAPAMEAMSIGPSTKDIYRDLGYVRAETASLARQLKAVA